MPNHVRNVIRMKGIAKLPLFSKRSTFGDLQEEFFDFNKLIPMPACLENTVAGTKQSNAILGLALFLEKIQRHRSWKIVNISGVGKDVDSIKALMEDGEMEDTLVKGGIEYVKAALETGCTDWYEWSVRYWGTKWNAYDLSVDGDDQIRFSTAWSAPTPVIHALSEKYPDAHIEHWWADEDYGNNAGYREYVNGEWSGDYTETDPEAYKIAAICWGDTDCLYEDANGIWHKHVCGETCNKC